MVEQIGIEYEDFELSAFSSFGATGRHLYLIYTDVDGVQHVLEGGVYGDDREHISTRQGILSRDTVPSGAVDNSDGTYIYKNPTDADRYLKLDVDNVSATWAAMQAHAQAIDDAQLTYTFVPGPNSNSVAASILSDSGFNVIDLLGLSIPEDISTDNIVTSVSDGEMDLFSTGFIGSQNVIPSIISDDSPSVPNTHSGTNEADTFTDDMDLSEQFSGGEGVDLISYAGNWADYQLSVSSNGFELVNTSNVTDTLQGIDRLQFADKSIALDVLDGNAGITAKILGAIFGSEAISNPNYMGIGLKYLDSGWSYENLMNLAINAKLGEGASHDEIVELLFTNVVGTSPTQQQSEFYIGLLESGTHTSASLGVLAADTSINQSNIDLVGLSQAGIEFTPA
ncbi:MAG: hypothetical protein KC477_07220 [Oceanospirillaceae bacterium]|nr:hypothetical protein [Oceanospirillaceae bacterium]